MKFTHNPKRSIDIDGNWLYDPNRTYTQPSVLKFKPSGLWLSVDDDWRRWCMENEMDWLSRRDVDFDVDTSRCKVITSVDEMDEFHDEYTEPDDRWLELRMPNWGKVAKDYSGIVIAPYIWERRYTNPGSASDWYYPWDCASACVWDLSILTPLAEEVLA